MASGGLRWGDKGRRKGVEDLLGPTLAKRQESLMEHAPTHPPRVFHVFRGLRYHQEWSPPLTPTATTPGANVSSFCPWGATCDHLILSLGDNRHSDVINERMDGVLPWFPTAASVCLRLVSQIPARACSRLLVPAPNCLPTTG